VAASIERVQSVRERLIADGTVCTPGGLRFDLFPVAIGPAEGAALRELVIEEGAVQTIEIGLAFAMSTLFVCEGLLANGSSGPHVAIDPYQLKPGPVGGTTYAGVGLHTLETAGVRELVDLREEESQIVLPRLLHEGNRFDLAFVDGNHRFEAVFLDLVYLGRLLPEGGLVFVDDTQLPSIRRAVEFCVDNLAWQVEGAGREGSAHEWLTLRTGAPDRYQRPFTEFVDFRPRRSGPHSPSAAARGNAIIDALSGPDTHAPGPRDTRF
jgi:predicted O-methyltransferase YrrM